MLLSSMTAIRTSSTYFYSEKPSIAGAVAAAEAGRKEPAAVEAADHTVEEIGRRTAAVAAVARMAEVAHTVVDHTAAAHKVVIAHTVVARKEKEVDRTEVGRTTAVVVGHKAIAHRVADVHTAGMTARKALAPCMHDTRPFADC